MGRNHHQKKPQAIKYQKKNKQNSKESKSGSVSIVKSLIKNLLILLVTLLIVHTLKNNKGYKWTFETLLKKNLELIENNKNLNLDQKYEAKLGFDYKYLKYIADNTPDSAIIMMPPDSILLPGNNETQFSKWINRPVYTQYFVYPRKLLYSNTEHFSDFYNRVTHIAVVNSWGLEKLDYPVSGEVKYAVMPIKKSN